LAVHPAIAGLFEQNQEWLQQLSKQVGGAVTLRADPSIAMSAGHAERP
jgi:hypothetical protein